MDYTLTEDVLQIKKAFRIISPLRMLNFLNELQYAHSENIIWKRKKLSLIDEWVCHNILYYLNIARSRTADVDLDYNQKWYYTLAYNSIGIFILPILIIQKILLG